MGTFILRRLLATLLAGLAVTLVVFVLAQFAGDPVAIMMAGSDTSTEELDRLRKALGYSGPPAERYLHFLGNLARGDLGVSLRYRQPVLQLVAERILPTFWLA